MLKFALMNEFHNPHYFRLFTEAYPGIVSYMDRNLRYQFVSANYRDWFHIEAESVVGKKVEEVIGVESMNHRRPYIDRALRGEKVVFQSTLYHKVLGKRDTEQIYHPDVDDKGEVKGIFALAHDVTDRLETERRAKESEVRFKSIADQHKERIFTMLMKSPVSINVVMGPELVFELFNEKSREYTGGRDFTGWKAREAFPEMVEQGIVSVMATVFKTGIAQNITAQKIELAQPDGSMKEFYLDLFYKPWRDVDGKVIGLFNINVDVTEQVKARKRAEERESIFRSYAESMPQMAFISDSRGEVLYFNKQWQEYTGLDPYTLDQENKSGVVHPNDFDPTNEIWNKAIKGGDVIEHEYRLRRHDGQFRWHLLRAIPLTDSLGDVFQWIGTVTDIHNYKETEVEQANALRSRDEFLSIASHELKTPLTSLKLQSQLFLRSLKKGDPLAVTQQRLENMAKQSNELVTRLSRLIDDMLDVSRIRTGKLNLEKESHDLCQIVNEVVDRMSIQFSAAQIEQPSIHCHEQVVGEWDKFRLEQVITNLLTNAIRYGQGKPIQIHIEKLEKAARLKVKDQGYGISKSDQERIFGRFERAINASEVSGMGLGLFITKEIIKAHQGEIWVESEPGQGATFLVDLPLKA